MEKDKFYGIVHPTFTLPIIEDAVDGQIIPITIDVKNFKGIGSMTCNILFDPLVLGPVTNMALGSGDYYDNIDPGTPPAGIPQSVWQSYIDNFLDISWKKTGISAHLDRKSTQEVLTFEVNPEIKCTGFDMGILSARTNDPIDPGIRERMGIKGSGDIGKIVFGMYSVPEVAMEDGTFVTIYMKYTNKYKNYTNLQFAWVPEYAPGQEQPQLLITDSQNVTIPTSELLIDENGNPVMEKVETPYYDRIADEWKIWISYKPKYADGVDYKKFYINGRIGPLVEKTPFATGKAIVTGKVVYGTTTAILPFTKVLAVRESDGTVYRTTSDSAGKFEFSLPFDRYKFRPVGGTQGIDWIVGDEGDYELAKAYRSGQIPIPDNKRWFLDYCTTDQGVEELNKMIHNINYCNPSLGYRGRWNSCSDPDTWPKPWDSFDVDAGDINAQGTYVTYANLKPNNKPRSRDGFLLETKIVNVTKNMTVNLGMVMISDIQGNALTVKKKVRCKALVNKTISTGTSKETIQVQCTRYAISGSEYCSTCLKTMPKPV